MHTAVQAEAQLACRNEAGVGLDYNFMHVGVSDNSCCNINAAIDAVVYCAVVHGWSGGAGGAGGAGGTACAVVGSCYCSVVDS